jgi:hypothetical protein
VQGDAGHPGSQGGGYKKNNQKKWRAKEKERHKGSKKLFLKPAKNYVFVHYLSHLLNMFYKFRIAARRQDCFFYSNHLGIIDFLA